MSQKQLPKLDNILGARATVKRVVEFVQKELHITAETAPNMFKAGQEVLEKDNPTYEDALQYAITVYSTMTNDVRPLTLWSGESLEMTVSRDSKVYITQFLDDYLLPLTRKNAA